MNVRIILMWFLTTTVLVGISNAQPGMLYERWNGGGTPDIMLTETSTPDYTEIVSIAQWGVIDDPDEDNYRARLTGWIMPPVTGNYRFWIITDDNSRLWLSTDRDPANYAVIARESGWRDFNDWGNIGDEQVSALIPLEAGKRYWIRGGYEEGGGGDHIQIAWASTEAGIADHTLITDADVIYRPHWAYDPAPTNGEFIRYSTDATELRWTLPLSVADSNEPLEVTCDVLWFGTDPGGTPELLVTDAAVESVSLEGRADAEAHYWWRVDCYDPNGAFVTKTEGDLWTFSSARDVAMVFIDESDGSTEVSEQGETSDTYTIVLSMSPASPVTVTIGRPPLVRAISNGVHDAEERQDTGAIDVGSSDLELGWENTTEEQIIGINFLDIQIPQGATITSATVQFISDTDEPDNVWLTIWGRLDDTGGFAADINWMISTPGIDDETTATVEWTLVGEATWWVDDEAYLTPDLSAIIQEIIDQPSWSAGRALTICLGNGNSEGTTLAGDHRRAESRNGVSGMQPVLRVEYTAVMDQITWDPPVVVLDDTNWEGVDVTVTAIDDSLVETDPHTVILENVVSSADAEWDAVTADDVVVSITENECGTWSFVAYDFDGNCYVDMGDLAMIIDAWLACTTPNVPGCVETYRP